MNEIERVEPAFFFFFFYIYPWSRVVKKRAIAKNGSSRCFFGQKRMHLKTIAAERVVGRI